MRNLHILLAFFASTGLAMAGEPVDIGSRLELFADDHLIDKMAGTRLELHRPVPREVAIVHDRPWEGNICFYHTVFRDGDLFRMYYRGAHHDYAIDKVTHQVVCYAESDDGIHWRKPELDIVEFDGSKKNSIIWNGVGSHNFAPFKDPNPACKPDEKYKALGGGHGGLVAFKSPDGIHWSLMSEEAVITKGAFDSQNLAFWDAVRGRYVDFHRGFRDGVRDIMTCTSEDFLDWTEPVWLEYPGAPKEHLYTNQIAPYYRAPHIFMGFPKRFLPSRRAIDHRLPGVSDGVFMTSRDGLKFNRWTEAFIRPGPQKERWVCRNNEIAWGMLETESAVPGAPNELSLYSIEGYYQGDSCQMRRYTIRIDGFVSAQAPMAGGELVTKPIVFGGKQLVLNFSTSAAGSIRVELQAADENPIEGFALTDCQEVFGDALDRPVTWAERSDVGKLAGRPIRLRFVMKDADLYSIRFR
jgi:hypothetical protein